MAEDNNENPPEYATILVLLLEISIRISNANSFKLIEI